MKEYDLFIPIYYNDGTKIEFKKFEKLQLQLLKEFGGFTFFPQPNEGFWKSGGVLYKDEIVIYRVLSFKSRSVRRFFLPTEGRVEERLGTRGDPHRRTRCRHDLIGQHIIPSNRMDMD